ncbi:MAG: hypothetical protein ABW216_01700 [Candidatus Rokuibacteriota bacterium]
MGLWRVAVWGLVALLVLVPTVRLAPGAGDHASHHVTMKASRASSGVGRTTAATPSVVPLLAILTARGLDTPRAHDRLLSIDPAVPFVPPRG